MTAQPTRATITPVREPKTPIPVHFNPTSLQISITNTLEEKGPGNQKVQYVSKSAAKLTLDLIFDTTVTGGDVRAETGKVATLMAPGKKGKQGVPPAIVKFEWGTFQFQGLIESYKETIDFFSSDGVPLRASLNLTLASQEKVFDNASLRSKKEVEAPVVKNLSPTGDRLHEVSQRAGNSAASRAIAADNGLESLRFASGPIALNANIQLSPPTAFATAGAGFSAGAGAGISAGAGFSAGGGAGFSAGAGASVLAGVGATTGVGITASAGAGFATNRSAGITASAGAFSELRTQRPSSRWNVRLDPTRLIQSPVSVSLANHEDATFQMGGQVHASAESGFYADVGAKAELRSRIQFS